MNDTPQTDAHPSLWQHGASAEFVHADFARKLERHRNLLMSTLKTIKCVAVDSDIRQLADEALSCMNHEPK